MYLEPPISKLLKKFFHRSSRFFITYANNWSKKFYAKKQRNRRQNNFPLKPPAREHVNFLNIQMYLEPPISKLLEKIFNVSVVSL